MKEPKSVEDIVLNAFERLVSIGMTFDHNPQTVDGVSLMGAYMARKRAMGDDFSL